MRIAVARKACIAVNSQREFERHIAACGIRHEDGTTCEMVGHIAAGINIVAVVVLTVLRGVYLPRHTCPLRIVARAFQATGQSADGIATLDVTHTTTETDGIGSDNTLMVTTLIGQDHTVAGTGARIEVESAEIDPGGAAHLLIDVILCGDALMPDGVVGIVDAAFERLVADIDGIASCLRDCGLPGDTTHLAPLASDVCLAGRS